MVDSKAGGNLADQILSPDPTSAVNSSLNLLLREDPLLVAHQLTTTEDSSQALAYAAGILQSGEGGSTKDQADQALIDVERKLALVESLVVKLSRSSPEALAGHLLSQHGLNNQGNQQLTIDTIREKADRLERQSNVLETVATRVETSLSKGLAKVKASTTQLERVLDVSLVLKLILRLGFENEKLQTYVLEDLRDLQRAAASVATVQELIDQLKEHDGIVVLRQLKPQVESTARQVRKVAAQLLEKDHSSVRQLASTLQVYFSLGELPQAVWKVVDQAHDQAMLACKGLWEVSYLQSIKKKKSSIWMDAARTWASNLLPAVQRIRQLERVLQHKYDPVHHTSFVQIVTDAPIPNEYDSVDGDKSSLFSFFWGRFCGSLAALIESCLKADSSATANLYPAVYGQIRDILQAESAIDDGMGPGTSSLGGSALLDDPFFESSSADNPQAPDESTPDSWTHAPESSSTNNATAVPGSGPRLSHLGTKEYKTLVGSAESPGGLFPLQTAFVDMVTDRLSAPLQYMFPEPHDDPDLGVTVASSMLPSKYDIQRFDETIRNEMALADPTQEYLVELIGQAVSEMMRAFAHKARTGLMGGTYVTGDCSATDSWQQDRKIIMILHTVLKCLVAAPETVYRSHTGAVHVSRETLKLGCETLTQTITSAVLEPLSQGLCFEVGNLMAKVHEGSYEGTDASPFVETHLQLVYENIARTFFGKLPAEYVNIVNCALASFSVYTFCSHMVLLRPLDESTKLRMTQDLADLELALEQLKLGKELSAVGQGKPYAELRAVRQMLFWAMDPKSTPAEVLKDILRQPWINDVRPLTVLHFLVGHAPSLLSSPHHYQRVTVQEYVQSLVQLNGATQEEDGWMTLLAVCDSYRQRATTTAGKSTDGDSRVADIVTALGPSLMQRKRV